MGLPFLLALKGGGGAISSALRHGEKAHQHAHERAMQNSLFGHQVGLQGGEHAHQQSIQGNQHAHDLHKMDTQFQRKMIDMQKAGLNPAMSMIGGGMPKASASGVKSSGEGEAAAQKIKRMQAQKSDLIRAVTRR